MRPWLADTFCYVKLGRHCPNSGERRCEAVLPCLAQARLWAFWQLHPHFLQNMNGPELLKSFLLLNTPLLPGPFLLQPPPGRED